MTVKKLFIALTGANVIQFSTATCNKYGIEDKVYCRADFFHKFRTKEIWNMEIANLHTSTRPILNTTQTILTITLR